MNYDKEECIHVHMYIMNKISIYFNCYSGKKYK